LEHRKSVKGFYASLPLVDVARQIVSDVGCDLQCLVEQLNSINLLKKEDIRAMVR